MFIVRLLLKIVLFPLVLVLMTVRAIVKVATGVSSLVIGGLFLFVTGYLIYSIVKQFWDQTLILFMIEVGLVAVMVLAGILESLIDILIETVASV